MVKHVCDNRCRAAHVNEAASAVGGVMRVELSP